MSIHRDKFKVIESYYSKKRGCQRYKCVCVDCGYIFQIDAFYYNNIENKVRCFGKCEEDPSVKHDFKKPKIKRCMCNMPIFDDNELCMSCREKESQKVTVKLNPIGKPIKSIKEEISKNYKIVEIDYE